ncbi:ABC transporter ATP-binding protein [Pelagicoccus sp. SDUM812005]|uniref:ABC transporter ATP-binding protein n=1 Tax=Pelagicoccus sp. SDUM812005 TaxID=3041257 RepID=UPI00280D2EAF|nr:ABC transporter ATP-binding protein [Pelagicoccus sp. SDUM812005]MDQ8182488.1 ABC transporter ATP-binding protein [Pelagicoccus sp. SDUM812005]
MLQDTNIGSDRMTESSESLSVLQLKEVKKAYHSGHEDLEVLKDISFEVKAGETVSIIGPSGSGKTTLLGICAGLDQPTSGTVSLCGCDISQLGEDERAAVRNESVGFVFQNFQLLPTLTALENVMVPLELRGEKGARKRAEELLEKVGLGERKSHYPIQLSGGEQQRVALARAFVNRPRILFADEPTGNLDSETSLPIVDLLFDLNKTAGTTLVLVTHDLELARTTNRLLRIERGRLQELEA